MLQRVTMKRVNAMNGTFVTCHWKVSIKERSHLVHELLVKLWGEQMLEGFMVKGVRNIRKGVIGHKFRCLGE
jgi:hypothetical protein